MKKTASEVALNFGRALSTELANSLLQTQKTCIYCGMIWSGDRYTCPRCGQEVQNEEDKRAD